MFKLFLAALAALTISGCIPPDYQYKASCKVSNAVLFERLTSVFVQEGLQIKQVTSNYLQAESTPVSGQHGFTKTNIWVISVLADTVTLKASTQNKLPNYSGVVDVDGTAKKDVTWYWNVRREIESICGSKVLVFERGQ
jgi:hypothetical protein